MTVESVTCVWKDENDKIMELISCIEKYNEEKYSLSNEINEYTRQSYVALCDYLKLNLDVGDDPMEKIIKEKNMLKEKIENMKAEIVKLNDIVRSKKLILPLFHMT